MFQRESDCLYDAFGVGKHLIAPKSDDAIALGFEPGCPPLIVVHVKGMLAAIDFDNETTIGSHEVDEVGTK